MDGGAASPRDRHLALARGEPSSVPRIPAVGILGILHRFKCRAKECDHPGCDVGTSEEFDVVLAENTGCRELFLRRTQLEQRQVRTVVNDSVSRAMTDAGTKPNKVGG